MSDFAVIFDMDGVILDSERVYQEIERDMYDKYGIPVSPEEHAGYMGTSEAWMWNTICEKHGVDHDPDALILEERNRLIEKLLEPGAIPFIEGCEKLLDSLLEENITCCIASSSAASIIELVLETRNLHGKIKGYVGGDQVIESKPAPYIYLKAAELAGTPPSNCIAIEDSVNGLKAAGNAGMTVIRLAEKALAPGEPALADSVISSLTETDPGHMRQLLKK